MRIFQKCTSAHIVYIILASKLREGSVCYVDNKCETSICYYLVCEAEMFCIAEICYIMLINCVASLECVEQQKCVEQLRCVNLLCDVFIVLCVSTCNLH